MNAFHNKDVTENVYWRNLQTRAQISTTSHFKVQYNELHEYRCDPTRIFYGRVAYNILEHKRGLKLNTGLVPTTDFADELLRRTQRLYDRTKKNVMQSYIRYIKYYDEKTKASSIQEKDYCYILQVKRTIGNQEYRFEILERSAFLW